MLGEPGGGGSANRHILDGQQCLSMQMCDAERMVFLKGRMGEDRKGHFRQRPGDIAGLGQLKEAEADRTCICGTACVTQALPVLLTLGEKGARTLVSWTE